MNYIHIDSTSKRVMCASMDCVAELSFSVNNVLAHYKAAHPDALISRESLSNAIKDAGISLLLIAGDHVACAFCADSSFPVDALTLQRHMKNIHLLRCVDHEDFVLFCAAGNELTAQKHSEASDGQASLYCPNYGCDYAVPIWGCTIDKARRTLYEHLRKCLSTNDSQRSLHDQAYDAQPKPGIFQGKRARKIDYLDQHNELDYQASQIPTASSSSSQAIMPSQPTAIYSSQSSQSDSNFLATSPVQTRRPLFPSGSSSSSSDTTQLVRHSSSSQNQLAVSTSVRADELQELSDRPIRSIHICAPVQVSGDLMLTKERRANAGYLFKKVGWWVDDKWYSSIAAQGCVHWYELANQTGNGATYDVLYQASLALINYANEQAEIGKMIHPGLQAKFLPTKVKHNNCMQVLRAD